MSEYPYSRYPPPFVVRCIDATNWPDDLPEVMRLVYGGLYVADRMQEDANGGLGFHLSYPRHFYRVDRFTVQPNALPPCWRGIVDADE